MIYTLTLNPAVDYYIDMNTLKEGELNNINNAYTLAGGKGINVSKVLKNFNIENKAILLAGGFTGHFIKTDLELYNIESKIIELDNNTRINIKLKTQNNETEIAGKSPDISVEKINQLIELIDNLLKDNDILVLAGSVPYSIGNDIYSKIIKKVKENKNIKIILDARDEAFKLAVGEKVFLTKPNSKELSEYFNRSIETKEDIIKYAKELIKDGSENVIISLGKEGSILITSNNEVYYGNAPHGKLISSVGCGDSMVAGIVYGISSGFDIVESYKYAIASGSSTAFSEGLTTFENMKNILQKVKIEKI